ncbi:TPA: hypothetical protein HA239_04490 [Candidatus Woesearchaeota archaeon]|nr:hypothetical protein QT06_C0001G0564 [archaeon GW2011_AR15]MBS3103875.1 hypothetical protein [Candidatus Woesearchaeota archaeon]HIH41648.1 hypothetical protein [Candidatus Woesearchaeota archaeon]
MSVEIEGEVKRWGNSFGIRLRKETVERNNLKGRVKMIIIDEKQSRKSLERLFGSGKGWNKSTQEIMDDIDEGWK